MVPRSLALRRHQLGPILYRSQRKATLSEGDTEDQKQGRSTGVDEQRSASITSSAPAERRESPTASSFLDEQGSTAGDEDIAAGALLRAYVRVYFVILDVVHALGIESKPLEKELVETALAMYRVCVERISLRNRIPEAFAVACVLLASERLATRHGLRGSAAATKPVTGTVTQHTLNTSFTCPVWDPSFVKRVVAAAEPVWPQANLALTYEYMRRVLNTLLERRPDTVEAIGHEMPRYCELLGVNTQVANLAHIIAERAVIHGVCARRTSVSVCAAAIYLATHLEDARRMPNSASGKEQGSSTSAMASVGDSSRIKQRDIAEKLQLSEVTLRKAHKEFLARLDVVLPSDYRPSRFLKRCLPPSYQRVAAAALQRIASRETASPNGTKETLAGTRMDPESALSMNMTALGACATGCNPKDAFRTDMPKQTMLEARSDESSRAPAATPLSEHRIGLSADTSSCGAPARQATTAADAADESGTADGGEAHRISPVAAVTPTMRLDSATLALCLPRAIGPAALLRHWGICTLASESWRCKLARLAASKRLATNIR
ncbi:Transcription initiation factor IIB [Cyanidiococcus yangmingshanensis]|uniref:Transcription initiation factor IIB n=1 Tax=Cyanidiococcus yangmingshanensis TaxID=2690220 RepID=A0A7J7IHV7_9RHOD|nr:Transcription initiation factor IIB [Cyanidiococcus yangmingshanensis]